MATLEKALPEINAAGASLVAISPQTEEFLRQTVEKLRLTFEILGDPGNAVARQFGLVFKLPDDLRRTYLGFGLDLEKYNGEASWTLPMPARYVLDRDATIRAADVNPDYTVRPEPSETLAVLQALRARAAGEAAS